MAKMTDIVKITCYGKTEEMTRKEGLKKYREAMRYSEGSERDRYCNIVWDLEDGYMECNDLDF